MPFPLTFRSLTTSALALGALSVAVAASGASASDALTERYAARAGAQVAQLSLLGRDAVFGSAVTDSSLDALSRLLSATATGTGTDLSPATQSVTRFGDSSATGGDNCATPPLGPAIDAARPKLAADNAAVLPTVDASPACGHSSVRGTADAFTAESIGGATQIRVKLSDALKQLVGTATASLSPDTLGTAVGDLVKQAAPAAGGSASTPGQAATQATQAVATLNGVLGRFAPGVALPSMEPRQTVGALLQRLQSSDLLHIDMATATARNGADAGSYVAEALSDGGRVDILPEFRGAGTAPLVRLTVSRSRAAVPVDRSSLAATPVVENAVVRVESDLLGSLPAAGSPLTKSGAGAVEVGPGQTLSVLCDGPVAPLCSEVSVGAAKAPVTLPNGATHAEASTVTMHLFKGLDNLRSGTPLGTVLAQPAIVKALQTTVPGAAGIGTTSAVTGVRLVTGGVVAEAGGSRVLGAQATQAPGTTVAPPSDGSAPAPVRNLPHTGGQPFSPLAAPLLLGSAAALAGLTRRTRRA